VEVLKQNKKEDEMKLYRVDQIIDEKVYEGGTFIRLRHEAEKVADAKLDADRQAGEYRTKYIVVEISV